MATRATPRKKRIADSYLNLVREFPLASIKSAEQLAAAQQMMDRLLAQGRLDFGAATYLDALSDLAFAYEETHEPIEAPTDADLLRHFLDAKAVTQAQLSRDTGISKSSISEILSGKKRFSRQLVRTLADYFEIDLGLLTVNF